MTPSPTNIADAPSPNPAGVDDDKKWYVMRDLKRRTAKVLAIHELADAGFEVFTPMTQMVMTIGGRRQRKDVPVIQDLLFIHESKPKLDVFVDSCPHLQYRYVRGRSINDPMSVSDAEMQRFIRAVTATETPLYYRPEEITEAMKGKEMRIVGGLLDGMEGRLLSIKGMRKRRLIVEIPDCLVAAVEVDPEFIVFK